MNQDAPCEKVNILIHIPCVAWERLGSGSPGHEPGLAFWLVRFPSPHVAPAMLGHTTCQPGPPNNRPSSRVPSPSQTKSNNWGTRGMNQSTSNRCSHLPLTGILLATSWSGKQSSLSSSLPSHRAADTASRLCTAACAWCQRVSFGQISRCLWSPSASHHPRKKMFATRKHMASSHHPRKQGFGYGKMQWSERRYLQKKHWWPEWPWWHRAHPCCVGNAPRLNLATADRHHPAWTIQGSASSRGSRWRGSAGVPP